LFEGKLSTEVVGYTGVLFSFCFKDFTVLPIKVIPIFKNLGLIETPSCDIESNLYLGPLPTPQPYTCQNSECRKVLWKCLLILWSILFETVYPSCGPAFIRDPRNL
jgi:hypothetical protein